MTNLIPLINSSLTPEMQGIIFFLSSQASKNSERIYCVGGFVRDLLLGNENRKLDLIVGGSAVDFARHLVTVFPGRLTVNEKFGTATLTLSKGFVFNMVTARKEFNPFAEKNSCDEELLKKDLFQRDFTINTLACSLNRDNFGEVFDYFGGLTDLKNKMLRVLYRLSFVDNPLRILRLIRLEQRFNFSIEEETNDLLMQAIKGNLLYNLSKESLSQEICLLFAEYSPVKILRRLVELKLFRQIFPRINFNRDLVNRLETMEGILHQMEKEKAVAQRIRFILFLSLLFYDLSAHDLHFLCNLMRLQRKERLAIISALNKKINLQDEDGYLTLINNILNQK